MVEPPPQFHPPYWDPAAPRPRFSMGKRVRVRQGGALGHVRTPHYVRGKSGVIERVVGHFGNPEELAYGRETGPKIALYRVRFALVDLWPEDQHSDFFTSVDTLDVEIYEHWLEPFFNYGGDVAAEAERVAALEGKG